jgi:LDH2 family malate/lactate/ureidoglycolate dehydrogenase
VTQLIEEIKATPPQPGIEEIRIPSERAFRSRERALREGLNTDRLVFDSLYARDRDKSMSEYPARADMLCLAFDDPWRKSVIGRHR